MATLSHWQHCYAAESCLQYWRIRLIYLMQYDNAQSPVWCVLEYPHLLKGYRALGEPCAIFAVSKGFVPYFQVSRETCMPNSICPRNSIFHRLFLNWGENIPKYFRSCSRVLKAIMLSFPKSVPFVVFCAWLFYHIQQLEPIFRLFHFQKLMSPNKTGPLIVFRGQKLGIFQWCVALTQERKYTILLFNAYLY